MLTANGWGVEHRGIADNVRRSSNTGFTPRELGDVLDQHVHSNAHCATVDIDASSGRDTMSASSGASLLASLANASEMAVDVQFVHDESTVEMCRGQLRETERREFQAHDEGCPERKCKMPLSETVSKQKDGPSTDHRLVHAATHLDKAMCSI
ncbi:hypothetical protein PC9H_011770 [Pleurotus ostreatus]|uniref:Uncharacterized protein n=1 Tax=Pleurotus ostreatus TaxID=5322 RepID=A0A8H6ZJG7_PLEOS|nr:uncharacterized protein PC9H_011770 [Pleurotus ostreatus]KAF7421249.1 hypothetical protein PC9H_011770 [Pleurotus ostreatus]